MPVAKMKKLGQDDSEDQPMLQKAKDIGSAMGNTARTFLMPEAVPEGERVYQDSEGPVPPSQTPTPPNAWYQQYGRYAPPAKMTPMYDEGGTIAPPPDTSGLELQRPDQNTMQAFDPNVQKPDPSLGQRLKSYVGSMAGQDPSSMPGQTANTHQYTVAGLERHGSAPMYDEGGVVGDGPDLKKTPVKDMTSSLSDKVKSDMMTEPDQYPKSVANTKDDTIDPEELDRYNQSKAKARMKPAVPIYDDGGPVKDDPNDGHHQMAILEEGERVLTPEQNAQYEQEHGAPADFNGRVLQQPNPAVRPMMDTEHADTDRISGGAKMDVSNPPAADMNPAMMRQMSATTPAKATMAPPSGVTAPKPTPEGQPPSPTNLPAGSEGGGAADAVGKSAMMQPEHNPMATSASATPLPNEREKLEAERSSLKQKMIEAAEGTHNNGKFDHIAYGEAKMALADLNKAHPWGQPGNHEGMLGKIGHGLATAGNIAAEAIVPGVAPLIPGSRANLNLQENQGAQQVEQGLGQQASQAETGLKNAQAQVAGMPKSNDEAIARAQFRLEHSQPGTPEHDTAQKELDANIGNVGKVAGAKQDVKPVKLADQLGEVERQLLATDPIADPEKYAKLTKDKKDIQDTIQQSAKLVERQREILAHAKAMGITDAATNQESYSKAQLDFDKSTTAAKAEGGFPVWKSKAQIQNSLATERALLVQANANANAYGLKGNELQQKADVEFQGNINKFKTTKEVLDSSDKNQVAANVAGLLTTLNLVSTEGKVRRLNTTEYNALSPATGSVYRWAAAHADKLAAGELPDDYKNDVSHLMDMLIKEQRDTYNTTTEGINKYFGEHAQGADVKQNPKGGTSVTPKKAEPTPPGTLSGPAAGNTPTNGGPLSFADWKAQQKQKQQPK